MNNITQFMVRLRSFISKNARIYIPRAAIIETLFKREYIRKERKNLIATTMGVDLILTIQEELLKSAELTGLWERKLRQIEKGEYEARAFLDELKEMVRTIVLNVKTDNRTLGQVMSRHGIQIAFLYG